MSFTIKQTPLLSIIIDRGRKRHMQYGITPSGPMDWFAYSINNRLLGNCSTSACVELHQGTLVIVANAPHIVAVTGYGLTVKVNGQLVEVWKPFEVKRDDKLTISTTALGKIGYVGFCGGIDAPTSFASRSTVMREQLGGLGNQGKPLRVGDKVDVITHIAQSSDGDHFVGGKLQPLISKVYQPRPLRVCAGNQYKSLGRKAWATLLSSEYKITPEHSRMGTRLAGPVIHYQPLSMRSEGLVQGTIQLPPNGQPIIMNADHQTMGGYPKIANVCRVDLPLLASLPIESDIAFRECDNAWARFLFQQLTLQIDFCFSDS